MNVHPKHAHVLKLGAQVVGAVHLHQAQTGAGRRGYSKAAAESRV